MDNIKFRAWDEERKEYISQIFVDQLFLNMNGHIFWFSAEKGFEDVTDKFEIEFFTGLHNKNGKELDWWEGDILKSPDNEIGIIEYNVMGGGFYIRRPQDRYYWLSISKARNANWIKIGSVHEKADLLEKEK